MFDGAREGGQVVAKKSNSTKEGMCGVHTDESRAGLVFCRTQRSAYSLHKLGGVNEGGGQGSQHAGCFVSESDKGVVGGGEVRQVKRASKVK